MHFTTLLSKPRMLNFVQCLRGPKIKKLLFMMRFTAILLLAACLMASASGLSQKVTLDLKKAPVSKVLREVIRQTGVSIIYDVALFESSKPVTIQVADAPVEEVLDQCLRGLPFSYSIEDNSIVIRKRPAAANLRAAEWFPIVVRGRVFNERDEPVEGVTVTVKGTNNATATDAKGFFALKNVDEDAILVFSGVNVESYEVKVGARSDLEIVKLKTRVVENEGVTVTVNTGYQRIPQERVTGSFSFIDNKTLSLQSGTQILDRLNGVASSVLFDNTKSRSEARKLNINIRGLSTINGSQDPLVVVDNFPYEGSLDNINPDDIESVTILKDAAAASIWGTKAGNGVIVITTKKARFNQRLRIELNTSLTVEAKPDLFAIPQMDIGDYIDVEQMLFNKGAFNKQINSINKPALSPAVEVFLKRKNGLISSEDSSSLINQLKRQDVRNDYSNYMYREAVTQTYSLNLSGGSEKYKYIVSGGYNRNLGDLSGKNERVNVRMNNVYKISPRLQLTIGGFYTNIKSKSGKTGYSGKGFLMSGRNIPYISFADANGNPIAVPRSYRASYTDTAGGGKLLDWNYYPLEEDKHHITTTNSRSLIADIGLQYRILNSLSLDLSYQYENQEIKTSSLSDMESYATRDLINTFSQLDRATGVVNYIVPLGSTLYRAHNSVEAQNFRAQLNFSKGWRGQTIAAIFGSEIRQTGNDGNADNAYGYNEANLTVSNVDFVNSYPSFINGFPQYIPNSLSFTGTFNRFVSLFGNAAYALKERYTLSASVRKDASNVFGVNANDKWLPFWSAGLGWNLSKEKFYKWNFLPYLKLRATYGLSGIVDQSRSAVTVMGYIGANNNYTGTPQAIINQFANNELSWEKVKQFNIGFDFQLKNQVIKGSIDYYIKNGFDLFGLSPIDYTAGLSTDVLTKNIADMRGKGMDIALQSTNIDREFKWLTNWLINYNLSKTTNYFSPVGMRYLAGAGTEISPLVGKSLYSILSYRWGGLDAEGNPQGYLNKELSTDYNEIFNSLTSADSLVYSGPAIPKYFGSIGNTFTWKGFSLSINITYKLGYFFRKPTISYNQLVNSGIGNADYSKRWQQPGDELKTTVPAMIYPINSSARSRDAFYALSEPTVLKGDQLRLQFIHLDYDLKRLISQKARISSLQLYCIGSNLGILWRANNEGIDPDFQSTWPTPKNFTIGLRASF